VLHITIFTCCSRLAALVFFCNSLHNVRWEWSINTSVTRGHCMPRTRRGMRSAGVGSCNVGCVLSACKRWSNHVVCPVKGNVGKWYIAGIEHRPVATICGCTVEMFTQQNEPYSGAQEKQREDVDDNIPAYYIEKCRCKPLFMKHHRYTDRKICLYCG
jgi:hypothetical protein